MTNVEGENDDQPWENPCTKCVIFWTWHFMGSVQPTLVGGLEHEFYDFPYIGNNHPNWLSYFEEG